MRPVLVTTSPLGGAGGATKRLFHGLRASGLDARMVIEAESTDAADDAVVVYRRSIIDRLKREMLDIVPVHKYSGRRTSHFSPQRAHNGVARAIRAQEPDVVNLHWICSSFVSVRGVAELGRPVVWTLHDLWPLTGGCHYSDGCDRFVERCGDCPILMSGEEDDLSRATWERKERGWRDLDITVVTPSEWLADCARRSSLFRDRRVEVIPYGIDLDVFCPKEHARAALDLPSDKKLILFGAWADTPRKGMPELSRALHIASSSGKLDDVHVVSFGHGLDANHTGGLQLHALGHIDEPERLALAYSAADVFVLPSLEDNLPTTVLESMACGTPCIGFSVGGVPDMIEDGETGRIAAVGDPRELAHAVVNVLANDELRESMGRNCRIKAEREYGSALEARRYTDLFGEVVSGAERTP